MKQKINSQIIKSLSKLKGYCEAENFAGWDPYDGLTSSFFRKFPFVGKSAVGRLVWIQLFKRNPINLRRIVGIPKTHNPKGIALFLSGYCRLYHAVACDASLSAEFGSLSELKNKICELADLLLSLRSSTPSQASCWGYNFPWQCRREFLFPAWEPTVVATFFAVSALFEAYDITMCERYLEAGISSANFVMKDLRRTPYGSGFLLSYSKQRGNDTIVNASLLGSAILSLCVRYGGQNKEWENVAAASVRACLEAQRDDGSWTYGLTAATSWIDSFHTGYNLSALSIFSDIFPKYNIKNNIEKGIGFYLSTFFLPDGATKYYNDRIYPIDIHCPGQLPMTLYNAHCTDDHMDFTEKVLLYAIARMQSPSGYFYYQMKKGVSSKISYMRWSNAFMYCSLSTYILSSVLHNKVVSSSL